MKSLIVVRVAAEDAVNVSVKGERENGSKIAVSYTAKYDGKAVKIWGSGLPYDTLALKQVDAIQSRTLAGKRAANTKEPASLLYPKMASRRP